MHASKTTSLRQEGNQKITPPSLFFPTPLIKQQQQHPKLSFFFKHESLEPFTHMMQANNNLNDFPFVIAVPESKHSSHVLIITTNNNKQHNFHKHFTNKLTCKEDHPWSNSDSKPL
jgi:hypothetical protein